MALGNRQLRLMAFNEVIAMHTCNLFADISIAFDIAAPGRSGNNKLLALLFNAKAQLAQNSNDFLTADIEADAAINLGRGGGDNSRLQLLRICLNDTAEGFAGTHLL